MAETFIVIDELQIVYSGYFSYNNLMNAIRTHLVGKGYTPIEMKNVVQITQTGRHIELEIAPARKLNSNVRALMSIVIYITKMKDKEVDVGDYKEKVNHGNIQISFASMIETDYQGTWRTKSKFLSFLRTFTDKYIYRAYYKRFTDIIYQDTMDLHNEIKAFLNLNKY